MNMLRIFATVQAYSLHGGFTSPPIYCFMQGSYRSERLACRPCSIWGYLNESDSFCFVVIKNPTKKDPDWVDRNPGQATNPWPPGHGPLRPIRVKCLQQVASPQLALGSGPDVSIHKIIKALMPPGMATKLFYAIPPANDFIWVLPATFWRDLQRR